MFLCGSEIGTDLFRRERPHFLLSLGGNLHPVAGLYGMSLFCTTLVQELPEHRVEATNCFGSLAQIFHTLIAPDSALGFGLVVELLDIQCGQPVQLYFA